MKTDHGKATLTVNKLAKNILQLKLDIVDDDNINGRHFRTNGLHVNLQGTSRLSMNFLGIMNVLGNFFINLETS